MSFAGKMDGIWDHHVMQNEPGLEGQGSHYFSYVRTRPKDRCIHKYIHAMYWYIHISVSVQPEREIEHIFVFVGLFERFRGGREGGEGKEKNSTKYIRSMYKNVIMKLTKSC
jgi:hypothetical protein